jgi:branched-chain amino acid transport system permease protein
MTDLSVLPIALELGNFTDPSFLIGSVGVTAGIYAIFALGLQLNVGYTGLMNFGQAGFMAVGAYAMAILTVDAGLDFFAAMALAILIAMAFGVLVGLPALRLRADYFAIVTLAAAELVRMLAQNWRGLTGGNQGFFCNDANTVCFDDQWLDVSRSIDDAVVSVLGTDVDSQFSLFLVVWAVVLVLTVLLYWVQRTPWGRVLRAIREDEDAARALGKNTLAYKLQSLAIAAALAAIAGFFLAIQLATVSPFDFQPLLTFIGFAVLLLGGLANYWGVPVGAVVVWFLIEGTRQLDLPLSTEQEAALRFVIVGLLLMALMAFRPQGLFGKRREMVLGE